MLKKNTNRKYYIYLAVCALLIFLYLLGWLSPIERLLQAALNPISNKFYQAGNTLNDTWDARTSKEQLRKENEELEKRLSENVQQNIDIVKLQEENEVLREFLGFMERNNYEYLMANIIARADIDDSDNHKTFVIDKGRLDGLYEGLGVVDHNGVLVGKISEVKEKSSLIITSTNKNCKFAASIMSEESTNGLSYGDLGLTIKMSYIPQAINFEVGDIVISSGLEKDIPQGLVIGEINEVLKESNEVWQEAIIEPLTDYDNLFFVSIILNKQE